MPSWFNKWNSSLFVIFTILFNIVFVFFSSVTYWITINSYIFDYTFGKDFRFTTESLLYLLYTYIAIYVGLVFYQSYI